MKNVFKHIWSCFVTGFVIVFSFTVVVIVLGQLTEWLSFIFPPVHGTDISKVLIGIAVTVLLIFLTGIVTRRFLKKKVIDIGNAVIIHVPIFRNAFITIRQILNAMLKPNNNFSGEVVAIEYPGSGLWSLGFITSKETSEMSKAVSETLVCVYIPSTPNPASGVTVFVPESDVVKVDLSPELVVKTSVSGGFICSARSNSVKIDSCTLDDFVKQDSIKTILKKTIGDPRD